VYAPLHGQVATELDDGRLGRIIRRTYQSLDDDVSLGLERNV
jgi:hypothetical protein